MTLEQAVACFLWCACQYALDGMLRDAPAFHVICDARYELGGMFP